QPPPIGWNGGMIETLPPLMPEQQALAPDHAPLLEQLATLWREDAAPCAENAALRAECRPAGAHPRGGSAAEAALLEFIAPSRIRSARGPGAAEGAALWTQARRPIRTPRGLPRAAAG